MRQPVEVLTAGPAEYPATPGSSAGPVTSTESTLAGLLADLVDAERVPVDSHFFEDLCADSLVMAHFCARVRKRADLPSVSMRDIYRHPTIRSLATALADAGAAPAEVAAPAPPEAAAPGSARQYILCGTLQLLFFLGYSYLVAFAAARAYDWASAGSSLIDSYLRSIVLASALVVVLGTLPIVAKWVLIGRWKPQQIRVWSLAYFRFWLVKTLIQRNPLVLLFAGSPLYTLYLRALGAKIGPGVVIFTWHVPACTDLLTIGSGTVIRKDSYLSGYRAEAGLIQTGAVTIGKDAFVGEYTVIDIGTSLGDGAQLGNASSLQRGQSVPHGERWHGSPAQRTETDYRTVDPAPHCGTLRRASYAIRQLLFLLAVELPLAIGGANLLLFEVPRLTKRLDPDLPRLNSVLNPGPGDFLSPAFYRDGLAISFVLFFGLLLVGLVFVCTVPRVLGLAIKPGKLYRLYGFHYTVHRMTTLVTNRTSLNTIFGDSTAIVPYLRWLGYGMSRAENTGSNFGTQLKHENPYLSSIGSGTMVADGLSIINADYSTTSFRVSRTSIGQRNFLGNSIAFPSQARTGDNCLIATKAMVPIDGKIREGVGLLGSPSFEIPRTVERDARFAELKSGDEFRHRLAAKNRHNAVTVGIYLLARWILFFVVLLVAWATADVYSSAGALVIMLGSVFTLLFTVSYLALYERVVTVFLPLRPLYCSIYDRRFWRHERFWKAALSGLPIQILNGTPFKNVVWRMLGVRLGKRVFDDGCGMPEKTLVTIGDDVTLNAGSNIQCHSQEDGAFKSDRVVVGSGCTVGIGAWVHYGVTMGDGAVLAPDAFLMKGEEVPPNARWGGNPAREMSDDHDQPA